MYLAKRSASGWSSTQLNPPSLVPAPEASDTANAAGSMKFISSDLSCSIFSSYVPLSDEVPATDNEFRLRNLFSRDDEGGANWRLMTTSVPLNFTSVQEYGQQLNATVYGASQDCGRVYFSSIHYEYLPHSSGLYESDYGTVRDAGLLPDGSTPAGATDDAVSEDGTKLVFSAVSDAGADAGKQAVFVRENGASIDVSQSETATVPTGATYRLSSPDGSNVFFTANAGLASNSSGTLGNSLYDYNTNADTLTDLSPDTNLLDTSGAAVQQVLASSREGGLVYFTAMGQLIPGKGKTYAENIAGSKTVNVYLSEEGALHYVTTAGVSAIASPKATSDGRHLLFTSVENITGYESGGPSEAYIYSAASREVQCVSCRRDGQPASASVLAPKVSEDGSRAFFISRDVLAPGAVQGNRNVYEWKHGQVFLLVAGQGRETSTEQEQLYGISASGEDVFFGTSARLVPQDVDSVADLYDARVGGGFAPPEPEPESCNPGVNCQGEALVAPLASNPASAAFSGPGNQPAMQAPVVQPKTMVKVLSRAQKLARALKACRAKPKKQRAVCDRQAEERYRTQKRKHPASKAQGKTKKSSGRGK